MEKQLAPYIEYQYQHFLNSISDFFKTMKEYGVSKEDFEQYLKSKE